MTNEYRLPIIIPYSLVLNPDKSMVDLKTEDFERKSPVSLSTLIQYGKIKEGDKLIFCDKHGRKPYHDEYAIVEGNGLRYRDFELDSPSNLAKELRYRLGLTKNKQETQGPIFWITENRKLLHDLNNEVREEMNVTSFEQMQDEKPKKNMVEVERQKESLREAERKKEEEDKPKNENIMRKIEKERASIDKCR